MQTPVHKHLFMADLDWLVPPPAILKQFRVYRRKTVPVPNVSWANLSEQIERRLGNGALRLAPGRLEVGRAAVADRRRRADRPGGIPDRRTAVA